MGSFNVLITDVKCSHCKSTYDDRIQFKYGDTWQLEYKIGDKIKWGGNDIGHPNLAKVMVYGILENDKCPLCQASNQKNEFDIFIENDVIVRVSEMLDSKAYSMNDGNYRVILE